VVHAASTRTKQRKYHPCLKALGYRYWWMCIVFFLLRFLESDLCLSQERGLLSKGRIAYLAEMELNFPPHCLPSFCGAVFRNPPDFWKGMICTYLGQHQTAKEAFNEAVSRGLPPALLTPLHWLKQNKSAFFKAYADPLLAKYDML